MSELQYVTQDDDDDGGGDDNHDADYWRDNKNLCVILDVVHVLHYFFWTHWS